MHSPGASHDNARAGQSLLGEGLQSIHRQSVHGGRRTHHRQAHARIQESSVVKVVHQVQLRICSYSCNVYIYFFIVHIDNHKIHTKKARRREGGGARARAT